MISLAHGEDASGAAAVMRAAYDDRVVTAAGLRYRMASAGPGDRRLTWKAERGRALVGWAFAGLDPFAAEPGRAIAGLVVHPEHRRVGIGSALWGVVAGHLDEIGATRVVAYGRGDDGSRRFAERCGFTLAATDTTSMLDPRGLPPAPEPPEGIAVRPLRVFEDDPEPVYRCDRDSVLDEPGPTDVDGMTFGIWRHTIWDHPDCDRDLGMAAVLAGDVVAVTFLSVDGEGGRAMNTGTGVVPALRGRGLGLLVKRHSLARAAEAGISCVITQNDETNAAILAINRRLGYRPHSTRHRWLSDRCAPGR